MKTLYPLGGLLLVVLIGCKPHATVPAVPPKKIVLERNVDLTTVQQKALVYRVETIGVLEAEGQTDIAAGVSGVVDQVFFREGDEVKAGTLLITIDQDRFRADEDLARANLERAKENLALMREIALRAERAGTGISAEDRAKAIGNYRVADAEMRSAAAGYARAKHNLTRSRVVAPYDGRVNKRFVTKGSYIEEKTPIATIADLSRIRLVGYVPESAAPVLRDMLATQDDRLNASRLGLALASATAMSPIEKAAPWAVLHSDIVSSGYDPEFEVFALPGQTFLARIFYMSTVGNMDTHMFECKAEVLGWKFEVPTASPAIPANGDHSSQEKNTLIGGQLPEAKKSPELLSLPKPARRPLDVYNQPKLWPGFTAKIRFPLRSSPTAAVIPEESIRNTERGFVVFVPESRKTSDGKTETIARARVVELGFRGEGWVEVRRGLAIGEAIVHRGAEALEDGTPIRISKQ